MFVWEKWFNLFFCRVEMTLNIRVYLSYSMFSSVKLGISFIQNIYPSFRLAISSPYLIAECLSVNKIPNLTTLECEVITVKREFVHHGQERANT